MRRSSRFSQGYDQSSVMDPKSHTIIVISHREARLCLLIRQVLILIFEVSPLSGQRNLPGGFTATWRHHEIMDEKQQDK
ncbi:hypothetical protein AVEN_181295-1 [Araneus ventricosus]|uniref:Uncharacterized protein n=1 Tax=Araneus ventricosus TaxID=182803 RepID=A0A4Y2EJ05_ARAVE|nr:hypothetical protein AVEN_181295-1 [Araneus ventricosus]